MSEYFFGLGPGWLPEEVNRLAKAHDGILVNYTDTGCSCGYNCPPHTCPKSRRHWFAIRNLGSPFDQERAKALLTELRVKNLIGEHASDIE